VETKRKKTTDLVKASVWKSELWRHADDAPNRQQSVERLAKIQSAPAAVAYVVTARVIAMVLVRTALEALVGRPAALRHRDRGEIARRPDMCTEQG
jgi:hypothetical protein